MRRLAFHVMLCAISCASSRVPGSPICRTWRSKEQTRRPSVVERTNSSVLCCKSYTQVAWLVGYFCMTFRLYP